MLQLDSKPGETFAQANAYFKLGQFELAASLFRSLAQLCASSHQNLAEQNAAKTSAEDAEMAILIGECYLFEKARKLTSAAE